jgi:hypothetical protein
MSVSSATRGTEERVVSGPEKGVAMAVAAVACKVGWGTPNNIATLPAAGYVIQP